VAGKAHLTDPTWGLSSPTTPERMVDEGGCGPILRVSGVHRADPRKVITCCLITTEPNELVATYHDRMPAVLPPDQYRRWLDNDTPHRDLKAMLRPFPAEGMTARLANPIVNRATAEGPEWLAAAATSLAEY
jgi:putative SOS response-associated peptidase YedK